MLKGAAIFFQTMWLVAFGLIAPGESFAQSPVADRFDPEVDGNVYAIAIQPDGRIVIGGSFRAVGGLSRAGLARLNVDGSLDETFNPGAGTIYTIAIQPDGKILVGGEFGLLGGASRRSLGRLNADGSVDISFDASMDGVVYAVLVQADGKIVVGGDFSRFGEVSRSNLGRVHPNGAFDPTFVASANSDVYSLAQQADGMIIVGGNFSTLTGSLQEVQFNVGRLNANGGFDSNWDPQIDDGYVEAVTALGGGWVLISGTFTAVDGQARRGMALITPQGDVERSFSPNPNDEVYTMVMQADGKFLVGGAFTQIAGVARQGLARFIPGGALDTGFNPGTEIAGTVSIQSDGRILVGGAFTNLGGQARLNLGRLNNTAIATNALNFSGTTVTWLRGETGPQFWRSTVEYSTNGTAFSAPLPLGGIAGGWQRGGIPAGSSVRVRGYVQGGYRNSSSWVEELYYGKPVFLSQPVSQTNEVGFGITLSAAAGGAGPLSYQWLKGNTALTNHGATTPTLTLNGLAFADDGQYRLVVSNLFGSVTSSIAAVKVVAVNPLAGALDTTNLVWITGGNQPWIVATNVTFDGVDSAQSGVITHGQRSWLQTTVVGPGILSFRRRVSSGLGDMLNFYVNGIDFAFGFFGERNWEERTFQLGAGSQVLLWEYVKDTSGSSGQDRAWLDNVRYRSAANGPLILKEPLSQTVDKGNGITLNVGAMGSGMLEFQWYKDAELMVGQVSSNLLLFNVSKTNAGIYTVVVRDSRGSVASAPARLTVNLADLIWTDGASNTVSSLIPVAGGKMIAVGYFTELAGAPRRYIGRLNAMGGADESFNPGASHPVTYALAQSDGKLIVGGSFTNLAGKARPGIGRLNEDGSLDEGFNPGGIFLCLGVTATPDGKLLASGLFSTPRGSRYLVRWNLDGSLDNSFNAQLGSYVDAMTFQSDGKIVVAGRFANVAGQAGNGVARLYSDGTMDGSFSAAVGGYVRSLVVQSDGKILVGGSFTNLNGQARLHIGRLHPNGTVDGGFNPGADAEISSIALQADGRIFVGGSFRTLGGRFKTYLGRLLPDGSLDDTVDLGANGPVKSLALDANGVVLYAAGDFIGMGTSPQTRIARIINTDFAPESIGYTNGTITWAPSPSGPEMSWSAFEWSGDGNLWNFLGYGARTPSGWQLSGLNLRPNVLVRAWGHATGGLANGSGRTVETFFSAPQTFWLHVSQEGPNLALWWEGGGGPPYQVQRTSNLGQAPTVWQDVGEPVFANTLSVPIEENTFFFRVVDP